MIQKERPKQRKKRATHTESQNTYRKMAPLSEIRNLKICRKQNTRPQSSSDDTASEESSAEDRDSDKYTDKTQTKKHASSREIIDYSLNQLIGNLVSSKKLVSRPQAKIIQELTRLIIRE